MSAPATWVSLQFQELATLVQWAPAAEMLEELAMPVSADQLARDVLRNAPPSPLQIEQAIEWVEDAVMPARARLPATLRVQTGDALLRAMASAPDGEALWLPADAVEQLFNRLAARAEGRPAAQDSLPVDGASAARLVILRELLHHWALDGVQLTA